jgi:hypothetical protein
MVCEAIMPPATAATAATGLYMGIHPYKFFGDKSSWLIWE